LKAGANHALGIIETAGRAPLIEAVDSAIKAAAVTLKSSYFVGGGVNTVTLVGDVGAMRAALDAAKATLDRMGVVGQTHLIPRLAEDVWPLIMDQTNGRDPSPPGNPPGPAKPKAAVKRNAALPDEPPVPAKADAPAETPVPRAAVPAEPHDAAGPPGLTAAPVPAETGVPVETAVPPASVPDEPPVMVSPPGKEGAPDKKDGGAGPNTRGGTLFPDEMSRSGRKASAPRKESGGASSGKNPRRGNPKPKS
jgi:microcompartment protein CcmL/EutN